MLDEPCPTCGELLDVNVNVCPACGMPRRRALPRGRAASNAVVTVVVMGGLGLFLGLAMGTALSGGVVFTSGNTSESMAGGAIGAVIGAALGIGVAVMWVRNSGARR